MTKTSGTYIELSWAFVPPLNSLLWYYNNTFEPLKSDGKLTIKRTFLELRRKKSQIQSWYAILQYVIYFYMYTLKEVVTH